MSGVLHKCRNLVAYGVTGQWWPLEPHTDSPLYGFSSETPFLNIILQSASTSTSLRIPIPVRHHEHLPQRLTIVRLVISTGKVVASHFCNILIAWNWTKTGSDSIGKSTARSLLPSFRNTATSTFISRSYRTSWTDFKSRPADLSPSNAPSTVRTQQDNLLQWVSFPIVIHYIFLHCAHWHTSITRYSKCPLSRHGTQCGVWLVTGHPACR
jgi:hypothetical protein